MKTRFYVNLPGCILAAFTTVVLAWMTFLAIQHHRPLIAVICGTLAVIYLLVALKNGAAVNVAEDGISLYIGGYRLRHLSWNVIREIGVVDTKVFPATGKKDRHGALYVYYADHTMNDEERFALCLKWPPKRMLYHRFTREIKASMEMYWQKEIQLYNVSDTIWLMS